eukprot:9528925-Alexandrium_andersonii.AAC.1
MPVSDAARPKDLEWLRMALGMREVPRFALKVFCFSSRSTSTRGLSVGRNRRTNCGNTRGAPAAIHHSAAFAWRAQDEARKSWTCAARQQEMW